MTFHIPKGMTMVATGNRIREVNDGNENLSEWRSEVPQAAASFNFGKFKRKEAKIEKLDFVVESYANQDEPDIIKLLAQVAGKQIEVHRDAFTGQTYGTVTQNAAVGNLTTTGMMDKALAEGQLAVELYTDYFGPTPYKRLAITQQTAGNYGQSMPAPSICPSRISSIAPHATGCTWTILVATSRWSDRTRWHTSGGGTRSGPTTTATSG